MSHRPLAALVALGALSLAACRAEDEHASAGAAVTPEPSFLAAVSPRPGVGPSTNPQSSPAVASDGKDFLAVWSERVPGETAVLESVIRAARIDANGNVLKNANLDLPHLAGSQDTAPAVSFDGASYLVVWEHTSGPVQAARVGRDGKLLDAKAIDLGTKGHAPAIASTGLGWTVAWREEATGVVAARVTGEGQPGARTTLGSADANAIAIGAAGDTLLVAWDEVRGGTPSAVVGVRVTTSNTRLDEAPIALAEGRKPRVSSNGASFLVAWNDGAGTSARFVGAADGAVAPSQQVSTDPSDASLAFAGPSFVLASAARTLRLDRTTLAPQGEAVMGEPSASSPAVAVAGPSTLVLRTDEPTSAIVGNTFGPGLAPKKTVRPARGTSTAKNLVSARGGDQYLAVWQEYRRDWTHSEIRAAMVLPNGKLPNEGTTVLVRGSDDDRRFENPSVVYDGNDFVVAWDELSGTAPALGSVRVSARAEVVGEPVVRVGLSKPKLLVGGGDVYLFANDTSLYRLDDLLQPGAAPLVDLGPSERSSASASFDGSGFVFAWAKRDAAGAGESYPIEARRFGLDGRASGEVAHLGTFDREGEEPAPRLAQASDGQGHTLVTWNDPYRRSVVGTLLGPGGATSPTALVKPGSPSQTLARPSATHDGRHWLVGYETRDAEAAGSMLARVRTRGSDLGLVSAGTTISATGAEPSVTGHDEGRALVSTIEAGQVVFRTFLDVASAETTPSGVDDDRDEEAASPSNPTPNPNPGSDAKAEVTEPGASLETPAAGSASGGCTSTSAPATGSPLLLLAVTLLLARRRRR